MNLKQLVKQKRIEYPKRMPKLKRIRVGKALLFYAALPLMSAWAVIPGLILSVSISPTLWAKDKLNHYMEGRQFK